MSKSSRDSKQKCAEELIEVHQAILLFQYNFETLVLSVSFKTVNIFYQVANPNTVVTNCLRSLRIKAIVHFDQARCIERAPVPAKDLEN